MDPAVGGAKAGKWEGGKVDLEKGFEVLLRLVLGGLFIYSGGAKALDPAAFQWEIANFQIVPWGLAALVAVYLPWLEIVCGLALVTRRLLGGGVVILGLLMVAFIIFVGSAWARGLDVTCGCFGASDAAANYPLWIARNLLILTGLCAIPWLVRRGRRRNGVLE